MVKAQLYNLANEEFVTLLGRVEEGFEKEGIEHVYVGGVANQIHVAKALCEQYNEPLVDLIKSRKVRDQDHLRATDDIDVALRMQEKGNKRNEIKDRTRIFSVLDYIVGDEGVFLSPSEDHIVSIEPHRKAHVRPQFRLGIDDKTDNSKIASFNFYRSPADLKDPHLKEFEDRFYDFFIDRGVKVELPYSDKGNLSFKVLNPADLLAAKIVRGRPKDVSDAMSLVQHFSNADMSIDCDIVRKTLCSPDERYGVQSEELMEKYDAFKEMIKVFGKE